MNAIVYNTWLHSRGCLYWIFYVRNIYYVLYSLIWYMYIRYAVCLDLLSLGHRYTQASVLNINNVTLIAQTLFRTLYWSIATTDVLCGSRPPSDFCRTKICMCIEYKSYLERKKNVSTVLCPSASFKCRRWASFGHEWTHDPWPVDLYEDVTPLNFAFLQVDTLWNPLAVEAQSATLRTKPHERR